MRSKIIFSIAIILAFPVFVSAEDVLGGNHVFNIESSYDLSNRTEISAELIKISPKLYWYADSIWWGKLSQQERDSAKSFLNSLTEEFDGKIYPTLTSAFGSEWTPGIDKDARITILLHPMKKNSGGYTDNSDEYPKIQAPESNEREMIYLNTGYLGDNIMKSFLAHEFVHLISFNQKERAYDSVDDVWLQEARAEYAPTLLGYDADYSGSNLSSRVKDFLSAPFDSLTEWRDSSADYGVVNLFSQYLVDHYGVDILVDSLKTGRTGIDSINFALSRNNFKTDFAQIFTDWAIAIFVNDCAIGGKYCYLNQNLKNFRITPLINYLPFVGESVLSVSNTTKDWAGNWHKFIGGKGKLIIEFKASGKNQFKIPYIIEDSKGKLYLDNLTLGVNQTGNISFENFGTDYASLTIIPTAQNKTSGFLGIQPSYSFFWSASTKENAQEIVQEVNNEKEGVVQDLKNQIMGVQLKIIELLKQLIQLLLTQLSPSASM